MLFKLQSWKRRKLLKIRVLSSIGGIYKRCAKNIHFRQKPRKAIIAR